MKYSSIFLAAALALALTGCTTGEGGSSSSAGSSSSTISGSSSSGPMGASPAGRYADGIYRGVYLDMGETQVGVEFTLKGQKVEDIRFRTLAYRGVDYLAQGADATTRGLAQQHEELLQSLKGKELPDALEKLYTPGEVASDIDGFTSATLRSGKIISAVRDGLNRGVYALSEGTASGAGSSSAPAGSSSGAGSSSSSAPASSSSQMSSSSQG